MNKFAPKSHGPVVPDAGNLLRWYDENARPLPWRVSPARRQRGVRPDPYRVWLSEIMAQQTTLGVVRGYYERFIKRWPRVENLAAASLDDVLKNWAGLGYYARARNLHRAAGQVVELHGGRFPENSGALMQLAGVGPYTGAAIAAICFEERIAVVDGNVERVMARFLALEEPKRQSGKIIRAAVERIIPARAGDFAQAMMDLGAVICRPGNPACTICPLQAGCAGYGTGDPTRFPPKSKKIPRPVRYGHAFVVQRPDGGIFLRKRGEKGLLARMSEVPGSSWQDQPEAPRFPVSGSWKNHGVVVHIFTHFRLELTVWHCELAQHAQEGADLAQGWWSAPERLASEALPSLFHKVLERALAD